jgi:hypothetical protein
MNFLKLFVVELYGRIRKLIQSITLDFRTENSDLDAFQRVLRPHSDKYLLCKNHYANFSPER